MLIINTFSGASHACIKLAQAAVQLTLKNGTVNNSTLCKTWLQHSLVIVPYIHDVLHDQLPSESPVQPVIAKYNRWYCGAICHKNLSHNDKLNCSKIFQGCLFIYSKVPHFAFRLLVFSSWSFFQLIDKRAWFQHGLLIFSCPQEVILGQSPPNNYVVCR